MTYTQLINLIKTRFKQAPGHYGMFDLKAAKVARKHGAPLVIIDGTDPQEIINAVNGIHNGTLIHP
jgi:uridylate kinase